MRADRVMAQIVCQIGVLSGPLKQWRLPSAASCNRRCLMVRSCRAIALLTLPLLLTTAPPAAAQAVVVGPPSYCPAPVVSYYAPSAVSYYASPAVSYYAAPAVAYYPAPAVSYYRAPVATYYAPAAVTTYYRYGLLGRRV